MDFVCFKINMASVMGLLKALLLTSTKALKKEGGNQDMLNTKVSHIENNE